MTKLGRIGCDSATTGAPSGPTLPAVTAARQRLGRAAEDLVAARLAAAGWRILERNARMPGGELDLVALDGATLVFVEVKAGRAGTRSGPTAPAHQVGPRKRARVRRLAREWLAAGRRPSEVAGYRFDVVGVRFGPGGLTDVDHIRGAF